jgi:hypothetical protein
MCGGIGFVLVTTIEGTIQEGCPRCNINTQKTKLTNSLTALVRFTAKYMSAGILKKDSQPYQDAMDRCVKNIFSVVGIEVSNEEVKKIIE